MLPTWNENRVITTEASLFLPISESTVRRLIKANPKEFATASAELSTSELAALYVIQSLSKLQDQPTQSPERFLAKLITAMNTERFGDSAVRLRHDALSKLDRSGIEAGIALLSDAGIALLDRDAVRNRRYLNAEGEWDFRFRLWHQEQLAAAQSLVQLALPGRAVCDLTDEQSRIYREFQAQMDDHLHLQGYAGTGKTLLVKSIAAMLETTSANLLVLAERQPQLKALFGDSGPSDKVHRKTFGQLAYQMIPRDLTVPAHRTMRRADRTRSTPPDSEYVRHFGIQAIGELSPFLIAQIVRGTVYAFCQSADDEINTSHIPNWSLSSLNETTRQVVVCHAEQLWQAILSPETGGFRSPVKGYHRIKWVALNRLAIPSHYTHVIIDECHDLSKAMLQILDGSPQAVFSVGDEYQSLRGLAQRRAATVRERVATHSVRSGHEIEPIVNSVIAVHPGRTKEPFVGAEFNRVGVSYYDTPDIPEHPAVLLAGDRWDLFEWVQRVAHENIELTLLHDRADLNMFVADCIELYTNGTRPRHGALFRFVSWDALANRHGNDQSFKRINRLLQNGYSYKDWEKTLAKIGQTRGQSYALGLVEDVRNLEFDTVMLLPGIVEQLWTSNADTRAGFESALYVAVTRARRKLSVPATLQNWLEEASALFSGNLRAERGGAPV